MKKFKIYIFIFAFLLLCCALSGSAFSQTLKIAFLNESETHNGKRIVVKFKSELIKDKTLRFLDEDLGEAARKALKYENPFNLSLVEAKNLGAAIDCEAFFVVKAGTIQRSAFGRNVYFESFATIFLVSARTGRLISWEHAAFEENKSEIAENLIFTKSAEIAERFNQKLQNAIQQERAERAAALTNNQMPIFEIQDETSSNENFRIPLPFKRLRPSYTEAANKAGAEATVDVSVDLNEKGEVIKTEIERWAGFGLDEETAATVKKMQFRPALKNGEPLPVRFLLRYNFRRKREES